VEVLAAPPFFHFFSFLLSKSNARLAAAPSYFRPQKCMFRTRCALFPFPLLFFFFLMARPMLMRCRRSRRRARICTRSAISGRAEQRFLGSRLRSEVLGSDFPTIYPPPLFLPFKREQKKRVPQRPEMAGRGEGRISVAKFPPLFFFFPPFPPFSLKSGVGLRRESPTFIKSGAQRQRLRRRPFHLRRTPSLPPPVTLAGFSIVRYARPSSFPLSFFFSLPGRRDPGRELIWDRP